MNNIFCTNLTVHSDVIQYNDYKIIIFLFFFFGNTKLLIFCIRIRISGVIFKGPLWKRGLEMENVIVIFCQDSKKCWVVLTECWVKYGLTQRWVKKCSLKMDKLHFGQNQKWTKMQFKNGQIALVTLKM